MCVLVRAVIASADRAADFCERVTLEELQKLELQAENE